MPCPRQLHALPYGAEITDLATGNKETYTGLTDGTIRDRISRHEGDCRQRDRPGTRLSDQEMLTVFFPLCTEIGMSFVFVDLVFYA